LKFAEAAITKVEGSWQRGQGQSGKQWIAMMPNFYLHWDGRKWKKVIYGLVMLYE
jgi:hypothetical protein